MITHKRISLKEARKQYEAGESIYLWPVYKRGDIPIDGIGIHVHAHKGDGYDLDGYIRIYKEASRSNMQYYLEIEK